MKGPGILWMLQTAAGFSMAGPIVIVGVEFLRTGRPVAGVGFLALGAIVLYFPTYLGNRIGGPRTWLRRGLDRVRSGDDSETGAGESDEDSHRLRIFDRIRR
ncbi:DUF7533 family protein [Natrinema salifodinae]|uniref:Uncharacterized protein n=1 Tax=Natrinema salifodinae TaxID=1202768 RepID=A0A1I0PT63_9EURY|nr:hypothetical protein [Natrinema salifodinae]SEW17601.1 hypothetical protein SAMN05216285_2918 [Natrinema salifodinae]